MCRNQQYKPGYGHAEQDAGHDSDHDYMQKILDYPIACAIHFVSCADEGRCCVQCI